MNEKIYLYNNNTEKGHHEFQVKQEGIMGGFIVGSKGKRKIVKVYYVIE